MKISQPYAPRPVHFWGLETIGSCLVKRYGITHPENTEVSEKDLQIARNLFHEKRMEYSGKEESNIGYLIVHKGMDCNYIVCCWWAFENMLRMLSFSSTPEAPHTYKKVTDGLDICVWDMLIHSHERNAFVRHYLKNPEKINTEAYVRDIYS